MKTIKLKIQNTNDQLKKVISKLFSKDKTKRGQSVLSEKENKTELLESASGKSYFVRAKSWAQDCYTETIVSRERYKMAFHVSMVLCIGLTIALIVLLPLKQLSPLLVNHYQDGRINIVPMTQPYKPKSMSMVESDIVRYVTNRESYDASSYDEQYSLITLMSDGKVSQQYTNSQSTTSKNSPINVLGNQGFRRVHINSVVFLDTVENNKGKLKSQQTHHNVAQVNFTVTDHIKMNSVQETKAYTALMSWTYQKKQMSQSDAWRDWNGFTVTRYSKVKRNV